MRLTSPHGRAVTVGEGRTLVMGVVNVTPDSFSDGGAFLPPAAAIDHALALVTAGAEILDVGAESTRPGYRAVPPEVQIERLLPVLAGVRPHTDAVISVDTTRAEVAEAALHAGADWINDTSALNEDPALAAVAARWRCPIVLMHRFEPARREGDAPAAGRALVRHVADRLAARVAAAEAAGIEPTRILLDPGIGFGTLLADNVAICAHVAELARLGRPLVVGPSRKSFLGRLTGRPVQQRLVSTAAAVTVLALHGADVVRVHDVSETIDVVRVVDAIRVMREH